MYKYPKLDFKGDKVMFWKKIGRKKKGTDYLRYIKEKTDDEIEFSSGDIEELKQLNPLYAHIKISQILGAIIPILEKLLNNKSGT